MIKSFKCKETEKIFRRKGSKRFKSVQKVALRKLLLLEGAGRIDDLRVPPGNRLERLKGARKGQYSIRINDRWRICFRWADGNSYDVEIVDYH
ncbi:MAG: type II toxin-antitoxin system RelE/ParE family toxin [Candidatus Dadabacteria bacterium]|nr:MAG: type II toxin-antitoxin system RelE/ParE family toxin [Candidatus Dadabacteria bacterium]